MTPPKIEMINHDLNHSPIATASNAVSSSVFKLPFELFQDQLGRTLYEISRMPVSNGVLLGGRESLANTLMKRCGYSLRTAKRHIGRLVASGLLECSQTTNATGMQATNLYRRMFD